MDRVYKTPHGISIHILDLPLPKIEQWTENEHFIERYEFVNGWILIIEWVGKQAHIDSSVSLTNYPDGDLGPIKGFPSNPDFVDRRKP